MVPNSGWFVHVRSHNFPSGRAAGQLFILIAFILFVFQIILPFLYKKKGLGYIPNIWAGVA